MTCCALFNSKAKVFNVPNKEFITIVAEALEQTTNLAMTAIAYAAVQYCQYAEEPALYHRVLDAMQKIFDNDVLTYNHPSHGCLQAVVTNSLNKGINQLRFMSCSISHND